MGAPTVRNTKYGYHLTGDTDPYTITTQPIRVKGFLFMPDDDDDTFTITDADGNAVLTTVVGPNADEIKEVPFYGNQINGLIATINDGGNVLLILVK